ncbi:MAG: hypothetical protein HJJLKODD_02829 [Phycisphaerae bacterium]|nr:hypothetical protein [Phycisphaerae bacterium]
MNRSSSLLLIHAGALGDLVLAVHFARQLQAAEALPELHLLCRQRWACYLAQHQCITSWKHLESPNYLSLFQMDEPLPEHIRDYLQNFDLIVSMLGGKDESITERLRSATNRPILALDPRPQPDDTTHILDQWWNQVGFEGSINQNRNRRRADFFRIHNDTDTTSLPIIIHPGSGGRRKCWPLENFIQLAQQLLAAGRTVQFMIGPDEHELFGAVLLSRLSALAPVIEEADPCRASERLASAAEYVGNDAGMTHVAAFIGLPTISIFTATDPRVWRPVGQTVITLTSPTIEQVNQLLQQRLNDLPNAVE